MKISGIIQVLVAGLVLNGCSNSQHHSIARTGNGIIGGDLVEANTALAQSVVGIYDDNEGFLCTGSLLPNNLIVTAAHCVGSKAKGVYIIFSTDMESVLNLGEKFASSPAVRPVVAMKANEKWAQPQDRTAPGNDIALMKYSGTTPTGYVPAKLLQDPSLLNVGAMTVLAGYGVDSDTVIPVDPKTPDLQQLIDSHEVFCDSDEADKATECIKEDLQGPATLKATSVAVTELPNANEVILDQASGHAACSGDSGGPAYIKVGNEYQLWGATSRSGIGCNKDIVYTNILTYANWIKTTAKYLLVH